MLCVSSTICLNLGTEKSMKNSETPTVPGTLEKTKNVAHLEGSRMEAFQYLPAHGRDQENLRELTLVPAEGEQLLKGDYDLLEKVHGDPELLPAVRSSHKYPDVVTGSPTTVNSFADTWTISSDGLEPGDSSESYSVKQDETEKLPRDTSSKNFPDRVTREKKSRHFKQKKVSSSLEVPKSSEQENFLLREIKKGKVYSHSSSSLMAASSVAPRNQKSLLSTVSNGARNIEDTQTEEQELFTHSSSSQGDVHSSPLLLCREQLTFAATDVPRNIDDVGTTVTSSRSHIIRRRPEAGTDATDTETSHRQESDVTSGDVTSKDVQTKVLQAMRDVKITYQQEQSTLTLKINHNDQPTDSINNNNNTLRTSAFTLLSRAQDTNFTPRQIKGASISECCKNLPANEITEFPPTKYTSTDDDWESISTSAIPEIEAMSLGGTTKETDREISKNFQTDDHTYIGKKGLELVTASSKEEANAKIETTVLSPTKTIVPLSTAKPPNKNFRVDIGSLEETIQSENTVNLVSSSQNNEQTERQRKLKVTRDNHGEASFSNVTRNMKNSGDQEARSRLISIPDRSEVNTDIQAEQGDKTFIQDTLRGSSYTRGIPGDSILPQDSQEKQYTTKDKLDHPNTQTIFQENSLIQDSSAEDVRPDDENQRSGKRKEIETFPSNEQQRTAHHHDVSTDGQGPPQTLVTPDELRVPPTRAMVSGGYDGARSRNEETNERMSEHVPSPPDSVFGKEEVALHFSTSEHEQRKISIIIHNPLDEDEIIKTDSDLKLPELYQQSEFGNDRKIQLPVVSGTKTDESDQVSLDVLKNAVNVTEVSHPVTTSEEWIPELDFDLSSLLFLGKYVPTGSQSKISRRPRSRGDVAFNYTWPLRRTAEVEGDILLGGLMMVHEREDTMICGPVMPQGK